MPFKHFLEDTTEASWTRFIRIAPMIKVVHINRALLSASAAAELSIGSRTCSTFPLLPNLRSLLVWEAPGARLVHDTAILLGPTVRRLLIETECPPRRDFFVQVPELSLHLTDFKYHVLHGSTQETIEAFSEMFRNLLALQKVELLLLGEDGLDASPMVSALAQLPALTQLLLSGKSNVDVRWEPQCPSSFPSLRRLELKWCSAGYQSMLNTLAPTGHLSYLQVGDSYVAVESVVDNLRAAGRHTKMESFILQGDLNDEPLPPWTLTLLHPCSALVHLTVEVNQPLPVTDADVAALASHLPRLRELIITIRDPRNTHPTLTLHSLVLVADRCPVIERITLSADANRGADRSPISPHWRLSWVDVRDTVSLSDMRSVALFLARLSASETLDVQHEWRRVREKNKWIEVRRLLQAIRLGV